MEVLPSFGGRTGFATNVQPPPSSPLDLLVAGARGVLRDFLPPATMTIRTIATPIAPAPANVYRIFFWRSGSGPGFGACAASVPGPSAAGAVCGASWPRRPRVSGAQQGLWPKNSATAARSAVTGQGGNDSRNARPYGFVRTRGSRIAITPVSACDRDQPPEPLPELEHGRGEHVLAEPVAAERVDPLAARLDQRLVRSRERQLVDHEQRERLAGHVDPLPERRGGDEHRVDLLAEALEQPLARRLALDEHLDGSRARRPAANAASARYELVSTSARPAEIRQSAATSSTMARPGRRRAGRAGAAAGRAAPAPDSRRASRPRARSPRRRPSRSRTNPNSPPTVSVAETSTGTRPALPEKLGERPAHVDRRPGEQVGLRPDHTVRVVGLEARTRRRRRAGGRGPRQRRPRRACRSAWQRARQGELEATRPARPESRAGGGGRTPARPPGAAAAPSLRPDRRPGRERARRPRGTRGRCHGAAGG